MRNLLKKASFLFLAVFLAFLVINGVAYLMLRGQMWESMYLRLDWELMDSIKPGFKGQVPLSTAQQTPWKGDDAFWQLTINSQGLRGPEAIPAKSSNMLRVICLGDSTTFGLGVDDQNTYPAQLEQILRTSVPALASHKINVLNAGVQGYSSRQGLVYLNNRLLKYHPDIVIIEFGYNDSAATSGALAPSHNQMLRGDIDKGFKKIYRAPASLVPYLFYQTPLTVLIKYITLMVLHGRNQVRLQELVKHESPPATNAHEISALEKKFAHSNVPPGYFLENLNQFAQLAKEKHFQLIFYIPYVIHPAYRQLLLMTAQEHKIPLVDFSGKHQGYRLEQLLENPGYAQLLENYRRHIGDDFLRKNNLYLVTVDCLHPNAVGNRIIAEEISRALISPQLYIP